jgi:tetratricopeptide (TPR) repeat protein
VKENSTLQAALENVILVPVDADEDAGTKLAKKFGVLGFPTFVMVNGQGEETDRWMGFGEVDEWVSVVDQGRKDPRPIVAKRAAYEEKPNLELARSLARHAMATGDNIAAVGYIKTALRLNDDPAKEPRYHEALFEAVASASREGHFTVAEVQAEADRVVASPDVEPGTLLNVAYTMGKVARKSGEMAIYGPYLDRAIAATDGVEDEGLQKFRNYLMPDHALFVEQDEEKAIALKKKSRPEGWLDDPDQLNSFAWWCFENRVNLEEAEELALRGARLSDDDAQRANILDTAAEICNARGDCTKAVQLIKEAIELDPDKEYFREQLQRFEGLAVDKG